MSERLLISIPEAAELVGLSRSYIWRQARKRVLPTVKWGKRVLVNKRDLEEFCRLLPQGYLTDQDRLPKSLNGNSIPKIDR